MLSMFWTVAWWRAEYISSRQGDSKRRGPAVSAVISNRLVFFFFFEYFYHVFLRCFFFCRPFVDERRAKTRVCVRRCNDDGTAERIYNWGAPSTTPPPAPSRRRWMETTSRETTEKKRKNKRKNKKGKNKRNYPPGLVAHWSAMRVRLHAPWRSGASANSKSRGRHLFWYPSIAGGNVAHEKAIDISSSRVVVVRDFRVRAFFHSLILRLSFFLISSPLSLSLSLTGKERKRKKKDWIKLFPFRF